MPSTVIGENYGIYDGYGASTRSSWGDMLHVEVERGVTVQEACTVDAAIVRLNNTDARLYASGYPHITHYVQTDSCINSRNNFECILD